MQNRNWETIIRTYVAVMCCTLFILPVQAGQVTYPDDSYTSGDTLTASDLNGKFNEVKMDVNDNDGRIAALEALVTSLQLQITALQGNTVLALDGLLTLETDTYGYQRALFSGVNVQVINGVDQTTINGLGNLIVGYNTARNAGGFVCSDGQYTDQTTCESNSGIWARSHKSGSHNIVAGDGNSYSQYGGVIFGSDNVINGALANISGGETNIASGMYSSVSGGSGNEATGQYSSISGGDTNTASGHASSVSGGNQNEAGMDYSSISGGGGNNASGDYASISGGYSNTASGNYSGVSGGIGNTASGDYTNVSGGLTNTASGNSSSVSGGRYNVASGESSSISGGGVNTASGYASSISGGGGAIQFDANTASGMYSSVSGGLQNTASYDHSSILGGVGQTTTSAGQTIPALP